MMLFSKKNKNNFFLCEGTFGINHLINDVFDCVHVFFLLFNQKQYPLFCLNSLFNITLSFVFISIK